MEKSYLAFVEKLRQELIRVAGVEDTSVFFKRKEEYLQTDEDRLYLFLGEKDGKKVGCGIYTQDLYNNTEPDTDLGEIVDTVLTRVYHMRQLPFLENIRKEADYEEIRSSLFIRLLNYQKNKNELNGVVYERIGDIALVLYQKLGEQENTVISVKIRESMLAQWHQDKKNVMENAMQNTCYLMPPRFYVWDRLLEDPDYGGEKFMEFQSNCQLYKGCLGNCLSTTVKTNGAVAVFFPGVMEKIAGLIGSGFYMVFTSVHEVMIHNDQTSDPDRLKLILRDTIEKATLPREILTYQIYHYDKDTGRITWE
ncbi:MAG: hypothetical protein IJW67_06225 [Blautia sp.]|nr:hypothetical protein [Blautia sp.]